MSMRMRGYHWAMHIGICALIALGTINSLLSYIALLACAGVILVCKEEDTLNMLLMIMSFAGIFKARPGSSSFFTYVLILYVAWNFIKKLQVKKSFAAILVFACWLLAVQFIADTLSVPQSIKFVLNFMFLYYAVDILKKPNYRDLFLSYIVGVLFGSLVAASGFFSGISLYMETLYVGGAVEYRDIVRFAGLYGDPNYYAINIIIALCLILILYHRSEIKGTYAAGLSCALVYFSFMTRSKSALLMLIWPVFLFVYSNWKNRKLLLQGVTICGVAYFLWLILEGRVEVLDAVMSRFANADDIDGLTTGRTSIWRAYGEYFLNNGFVALFGNGLGAGFVNGRAAHNTYIDALYYLGVIGSAYMVALIAVLSRNVVRNKSRNLLNWSVIASVLVMYTFLSQLFYFDMVFHILIAIVVWNI